MSPHRHNALERALLNDYQRDFPLCTHPFRVLAEQLGTDEDKVLTVLQKLHRDGSISRVGPVFRPNTVGASTLAAVSAPPARVEEVARTINDFPEINHNYEREHRFNLWFVANADSAARRDGVLEEIAGRTGLDVMSLPLVRDYYIDLGFDIDFGSGKRHGSKGRQRGPDGHGCGSGACRSATGELIPVLQRGLPLVHAPFAEVAAHAGLSQEAVIAQVAQMLQTGTIRRFGVVVRHHELGYRANAMCVWDVAEDRIDELGGLLADVPFVTLCYRRPRRLPHWRYNLFCMIHGKDRDTVMDQVDGLNRKFELKGLPRDVLFSGRRFKQRGAVFRAPHLSGVGKERAAHG